MLEEVESGEILSNLYYKRINALSELNFKGAKLENQEYQKQEVMSLKNQVIQANHLGGTDLTISKEII